MSSLVKPAGYCCADMLEGTGVSFPAPRSVFYQCRALEGSVLYLRPSEKGGLCNLFK